MENYSPSTLIAVPKTFHIQLISTISAWQLITAGVGKLFALSVWLRGAYGVFSNPIPWA
jgi:hypothetical protein